MKKMLLALAAAVAAFAAGASANPGSPFCGGGGCGHHKSPLPLFHKAPVPAFQAAPWYLYWPYNAHFQTPGPLAGAPYFGPPYGGGALVNPFFPASPYGYGPAYGLPPGAVPHHP
jgi:hypothetical protein